MPSVGAALNSRMTSAKIEATSVARVAIQAIWPNAIAYGAERGRVHRVVAPDPAEPAEHRERGLERRALHHRRHQQRRARGTGGTARPAASAGSGLVDVRPEADAHRDQEQHRLGEVAEDRAAPGPPVEQPHVLVGGQRAADAGPGAGRRCRGAGRSARARCRRPAGSARSLDEAPAGEPQEHVLERAPPDEDGLGTKAALMGGDRGRLAVVGVDEHAVRQPLDALADAVELAVERVVHAPSGSAAP